MTLKKLCKALGWKPFRRWRAFIEHLQYVVAIGEDTIQQLEKEDKTRALIEKHTSVASSDEIVKAMRRSLIGGDGMYIVPCDTDYWILDGVGWQHSLDFTGVDKKRYISERFDCDNFAIVLAAIMADKFQINSVGIVFDFSGGHAYAVLPVRQEDGSIEMVILEPQNDQYIVSLGGMYQGKFGIAIFA